MSDYLQNKYHADIQNEPNIESIKYLISHIKVKKNLFPDEPLSFEETIILNYGIAIEEHEKVRTQFKPESAEFHRTLMVDFTLEAKINQYYGSIQEIIESNSWQSQTTG